MKKKTAFLSLIILAILQATIFNYFRIFQVKPDLLLISVVFIGLSAWELRWVLFFAILAGAFKDIFTANTFGINTLLFPLWGFLIMKLAKKVSLEGWYIRAGLVFVTVVLNVIVARAINLSLGNYIPTGIFLRVTFWESLYTLAVSLLIFRFIP